MVGTAHILQVKYKIINVQFNLNCNQLFLKYNRYFQISFQLILTYQMLMYKTLIFYSYNKVNIILKIMLLTINCYACAQYNLFIIIILFCIGLRQFKNIKYKNSIFRLTREIFYGFFFFVGKQSIKHGRININDNR